MPETGSANIEVAHHLSRHKPLTPSTGDVMLEIVEALVLAVVAIATAWSGYQAALWNGRQSELYGQATGLRVEAETATAEANEERLYSSTIVTEWLKAEARGERKLADFFERRILPELRPVFETWKNSDPLKNPQVVAGPFLLDFRSAKTAEALRLNKDAADVFDKGTRARHLGDDYVRVTVLLATVLLLIGISQRFHIRNVRLGLTVISAILLVLCIYHIATLPRI
jgi:hypothetical protein